MKKVLVSMLSVLIAFGAAANVTVNNASAAVGDSVSYTADFSSGLPSDWQIYDKSVTNSTSVTKSTDGIRIKNTNGGSDKTYYGGLFNIAKSIGNLGDFEISVRLRFISSVNVDRWVGILYHTQFDASGMLSAYMMNYRVRGKSAQSSVTATPAFNDSLIVENTGVPFGTDYHTLKVTMAGGIAAHYIDDSKIVEYDISRFDTVMGGRQTEGGFALIVNLSEVEISNLTISGKQGHDEPIKIVGDTVVADTYTPVTALLSAPTIAAEVNTASDLTALSQEKRAANAILTIDKNMNVLGGNSTLCTFDEIYTSTLQGRIIPVVYLTDAECATAFSDYLKNRRDILDIAVMGSTELVSSVRRSNQKIRGIIDWSGENVTSAEWQKVVAETNKAYANVVVLSAQQATYEAVTYIQARLKSVWIKANGASEFETADLISRGPYGLVTDDPYAVMDVYENYVVENASVTIGSVSDKLQLTRTPYNVAHRGLPIAEYENSMEGYIEAYNNGATHLEVDAHLTADKKIVIMHDNTLNRTTNYTGSKTISQMTLSEIKQYKILRNCEGEVMGDGVEIPDIDQLFDYFQGKDVVFAFEIKDGNTEFIKYFKEALDNYEIYSQVFVISFNTNQIEKLRDDVPEVPTANLNTLNINNFAAKLAEMGAYNTAADTSGGTSQITKMLLDRGYGSWYWTYSRQTQIDEAIRIGTLGITNNEAHKIRAYAKKLVATEKYTVVSESADLSATAIPVSFLTYEGKKITANTNGAIFVERHEQYAYVIVKSVFAGAANSSLAYALYSEPIKVIFAEYYLSVARMQELLSKPSASFNEQDKIDLEKLGDAYQLLDDDDKATVDISGLDELKNQVASGGADTDPPATAGGCKSSADGTFAGVAVIALAAAIVLVRKRKNKI